MNSSIDILKGLTGGTLPTLTTGHPQTPAGQDLATTYKVLKHYYSLSEEEITLIEKITGIDASILRLKKFKEKKDFELDQVKKDQLAKENYIVKLKMLLDAYESRYQDQLLAYNKKAGWIKLLFISAPKRNKKVPDLSAQYQFLRMNIDPTKNSTTHLYDAYIDSIDKKIAEIKKNVVFTNHRHLDNVRAMIVYHRDARQDLIHSSVRLIDGASRPANEKGFMGKLKSLWNWFNSQRSLAQAHDRKTTKHLKLLPIGINRFGTIADDLEQQTKPLVASYGSDVGPFPGIIQMRDIVNVQDGKNLALAEFHDSLQADVKSVNEICQQMEDFNGIHQLLNSCLNLSEAQIKEKFSKEKANIRKVFVNFFKLNCIAKNKHESILAIKKFIGKEIIQNLKTITAEDSRLITSKLQAMVDAVKSLTEQLHPLSIGLFVSPSEDNSLSWKNNTLGEMHKQFTTTKLGAITPKRVVNNTALVEIVPGYPRDNVANDLVNTSANYIRQFNLDNNSVHYQDKSVPVHTDLAERNIIMTNLSNVIKAQRIVHAADLRAFLTMGKDFAEKHGKLGINTLIGTEQYVSNNYKSLMATAIKFRDHLDIFLKNLVENKKTLDANEGNVEQITSAHRVLLDKLAPMKPGSTPITLGDRYNNLIANVSKERQRINEVIFVKTREVKQAVKFATGQLSYQLEKPRRTR